jgi:nucleoside-diphosphate-sugar epimerase
MNSNRKCIAVTGAAGFIGRHLVGELSDRQDVDIRLLFHSNIIENLMKKENIIVFEGDLLKPESLSGFLNPGCTVINLVNLRNASEKDNLAAMTNLAVACRNAQIKKLVHCSTAVVVGAVSEDDITEETQCHPTAGYESIKYKIESLLVALSANHFELAILRPTAVFGKGGKNLLKMADELSQGNRFINYLKSSLFDHRRMNLVFVLNVAAVLIFLADMNRKMNGDIFIISDDDPMNNYRDVERLLMSHLGCRDYAIPRLPLPSLILRTLLKLTGKSNVNPNRMYHSRKIMNAGFKKVASLETGLVSFANWYKKSHASAIR